MKISFGFCLNILMSQFARAVCLLHTPTRIKIRQVISGQAHNVNPENKTYSFALLVHINRIKLYHFAHYHFHTSLLIRYSAK